MRRLFVLVTTLGLSACAGPAYSIAAPSTSPLAAPCRVYLEPVHLENLKIGKKTEAEWQSTKKPESQAGWQKDKQAFESIFHNELVGRASFVSAQPVAGAYILRPYLQFFEPGYYAFVAAKRAESRMTLQLLDPSGALLEEVSTGTTGTDLSVGQTIRIHGQVLARHFAQYAAEHLQSCAK